MRRLERAKGHNAEIRSLSRRTTTGTTPVGTTTGWNNYRYIRYCATLKPKDFPDRAVAGRFLDRFKSLSLSGTLLGNENNNNQFWARPIVTSQ
jgi:hypothetical protein